MLNIKKKKKREIQMSLLTNREDSENKHGYQGARLEEMVWEGRIDWESETDLYTL